MLTASRCKGSCIGLTHALATQRHLGKAFAIRVGAWVIAIYVTTLVTNLTATGELTLPFEFYLSDRAGAVLLAVRLWKVDHRTKVPKAETHLHVVFRVVVESGMIYTVISVVTLVLFVLGSPTVYFVRDLVRAYSAPYFSPSSHARPHRVHLRFPSSST